MSEAEFIAARINRLRDAGKPVPLILEQRLLRLNTGTRKRLPKHARCGFKSDSERDNIKIQKRFK